MPFEPKDAPKRAPHVIDPVGGACMNCGASPVAIHCGETVCEPDSEKARKFRREKTDKALGRAMGY